MTNPIVIGIDAGGTMTDTILVDPQGRFTIGKAATTPDDESEGFIASAEDAADAWGITLDELFGGLDVVLYSGTGMLNTLLSRTGRRLGLITTKGLEDMILMGRGLQAWSDYSYSDRLHAVTHAHPDPLVPRRALAWLAMTLLTIYHTSPTIHFMARSGPKRLRISSHDVSKRGLLLWLNGMLNCPTWTLVSQ